MIQPIKAARSTPRSDFVSRTNPRRQLSKPRARNTRSAVVCR
jgi:hypothetical protein